MERSRPRKSGCDDVSAIYVRGDSRKWPLDSGTLSSFIQTARKNAREILGEMTGKAESAYVATNKLRWFSGGCHVLAVEVNQIAVVVEVQPSRRL